MNNKQLTELNRQIKKTRDGINALKRQYPILQFEISANDAVEKSLIVFEKFVYKLEKILNNTTHDTRTEKET